MPLKIPVVQTGLEASIQAAAQKAGKSLKINMGSGAKSIEGLSQPLGRITGKADQFTKSMEAANARVLAFGASVGVLSAVTRGFQNLVVTTIEVEKSLASINSILGTSEKQLKDFGKTIFDVAKNTEQSFDTVANAALELSRQGLSAAEVQKRLSDSLILTRLSGLGASEAVAGLTAAINSFNKEGLSSAEVLNKLSAAAVSAAVSERDLIEGIKRSGSVAVQAGVSFDELVGVITAVQKTTARGGAVIGNSFKTIFTRIQSIDKLETMQNLGVQVTDASGQVLGATKLIQNLSKVLGDLPDAKKLQIAENLVGKFQIAPFLAILEDYNKETSTAISVTQTASNAFNEAYSRNVALNQTLSAAINEATVSLKELANTLGEIGVTDSLQNLLGFFNGLVGDIKEVLDGEGLGGDLARGLVKGIGAVISGPGLAIFGAIILKLGVDLAKFGVGSLKTFFGLNKAAQEQATLQGQIASTLLGNESIQKQILAIENSQLSVADKRKAQVKFFTTALNEQVGIMTKMQGIAATIAPKVLTQTRPVARRGGRSAGGFIPNYNAVAGYGSESSDISKGVGGAPSSARPVTIPNFNFGGGQKGTMIANNSEYMVPNFAGGDGSAIFNQDMISSMGLPAGARKIGAAGGYIPNFAADPRMTLFNNFLKKQGKDFRKLDPDPKDTKRGRLKRAYEGSEEGREFDNLSKTELRNLKVTGRQKSVVGKGTEHMSSYGILYPDARGNESAKTITHKNKRIRAIPVATEPSDILYKQVRESLVSAASKYAEKLGFNPDIIKEKKFKQSVDKNLNEGAVEGAFGTVFEAAFQGAIGTEQKSNVRWDLQNRTAIEGLLSKISSKGLLSKIVRPELQLLQKADFKNSLSDGNLNSVLAKIKSSPIGKAAGGYIPNFAGGLGDAIARESAAGLPINQIRINQDPSLKNSGNPMGLAVTNTRDEPTGAIPNFAKSNISMGDIGIKKDTTAAAKSLKSLNRAVDAANKEIKKGTLTRAEAEKSLKAMSKAVKTNGATQKKLASAATGRLREDKEVASGNRDLLGGIFAVQAGMTLLGGATDDASEGLGRYTNIVAEGIATGSTAAFALEGLGGSLEGMGGKVGKAGAFIKGLSFQVGLATAAFKIGTDIYDQMTGTTNFAADAMARVAESSEKAAIRLDMLSPSGKRDVQKEIDELATSAFEVSPEQQANMSLKNRLMLGKTNRGGAFNTGFFASTRKANFEGSDLMDAGQSEEALKASIGVAVTAGGDKDAIFKQIEKIKIDGFISNAEMTETQDFLDSIIRKANLFTKELEKGSQELTSDQINALRDIDEEDLRDVLSGKKGNLSNLNDDKKAQELRENILGAKTAVFEGKGDISDTNKNERLLKLRKGLIKLKDEETKKDKEAAADKIKAERETARIATSAAKERIRMAVERAKLNDSALDKAKSSLEFRKIDGDLSAKDLAKEQSKIKILEAENDSRKNTLANVIKIVDLTGELTTKTDAVKKLEKLIEESSKDSVISEKERALILKATNKVLEENTDQKKSQLISLRNDIGLSKEQLDITKKRLEAERKITLARLEASRVEEVAKVGDDLTRGRASREILTPDIRKREEIQERMRKRGRGLQTDFSLENIELAQAQDGRALVDVNERITRRTGFETDLQNTQSAIRSALDKLDPTVGGSQERVIEMMKGVVDQKSLDNFIKQEMSDNPFNLVNAELGSGFSAIEGMNQVLSELQEKMVEERKVREDNIKSSKDEADTKIRNAAITKGLPDTAFLLKNQAKALLDARVGDLLNSNLSTDPAARIKGRMSDGNFDKRFGFMMDNDVEGLRLLNEQEEFSFQLVDASVQFARNIGDAMTQAIAEGGNLKDLLLGAASGFFNTLSQAFMQKAVNNIISGFNAGGKVRGGSGNRDDVPALLTGGEFVMKKSSVNKYGSSFMAALNAGAVPTMQRGGLFTPGTYGQGVMKGKDNLLDFATQGFTTGNFDKVRGGSGFASVNLAPQSGALTMFGRRNSPAFQREQASKEAAFGLFTQQANKEAQLKEKNAMAKKGLLASVGSALFSFGFNSLTDLFSKKATGGSIPYTSGVDTVPTMLSGGEFVMNAAATQRIGRGNLNALNSGAGGGSGEVVGKLDELIAVSDNSGETVINITVNSDGSSNSQGNGDDQQNSLATKIKDVVRQVIDDEKRLGGSLRQARA